VEDDVDVWCYAILELHAINDDDDTVQKAELTYDVAVNSKLQCKQNSFKSAVLTSGVVIAVKCCLDGVRQ